MMKKINFAGCLLISLWMLSSCEKASMSACDLQDPLSESKWLQKLSETTLEVEGEEVDHYTYPVAYQVGEGGESFFIMDYFSGMFFCGTGLQPHAVYKKFSCTGEEMEFTYDWDELQVMLKAGTKIWDHYSIEREVIVVTDPS